MKLVSDIDEILREGKRPISEAVQASLSEHVKGGIFITGAPLSHVPKELFLLPGAVIFAEHGGIRWEKGLESVIPNARDIETIREKLGISVKDGLQEINGQGSVIIEGPRSSGLTLLFGSPLHYPFRSTASRDDIKSKVEAIIEKENLRVLAYPGEEQLYTWLDLITVTKSETISGLIKDGVLSVPFYYMGDKSNDLEVMRLEGAIPVAFPNCIKEIISLAEQKGIYIPYLPYREGIPKFFDLVINGKP